MFDRDVVITGAVYLEKPKFRVVRLVGNGYR